MRNWSIAISVLLAMVVFPALALGTPRIIPRSDRVAHPIDQVFGTLKALLQRFFIERLSAHQCR